MLEVLPKIGSWSKDWLIDFKVLIHATCSIQQILEDFGSSSDLESGSIQFESFHWLRVKNNGAAYKHLICEEPYCSKNWSILAQIHIVGENHATVEVSSWPLVRRVGWTYFFFALLPSASQLPLSAASDILPTQELSFPLCKSTTKSSCFTKCPFTIFSNGISVRLDHHLLRKQSFMSAKIHGLPGDVDRRLRQRKSCRFVNILLQSIFGQGWEAGYSAQLPAHWHRF